MPACSVGSHALLNTSARRLQSKQAAALLARTLQRQRGCRHIAVVCASRTGSLSARATGNDARKIQDPTPSLALDRARRSRAYGHAARAQEQRRRASSVLCTAAGLAAGRRCCG